MIEEVSTGRRDQQLVYRKALRKEAGEYRDISRRLTVLGCRELERRRGGSHRKWHNPVAGRATVLLDWGGRDLKLGTVRAAIRQLGVNWPDSRNASVSLRPPARRRSGRRLPEAGDLTRCRPPSARGDSSTEGPSATRWRSTRPFRCLAAPLPSTQPTRARLLTSSTATSVAILLVETWSRTAPRRDRGRALPITALGRGISVGHSWSSGQWSERYWNARAARRIVMVRPLFRRAIVSPLPVARRDTVDNRRRVRAAKIAHRRESHSVVSSMAHCVIRSTALRCCQPRAWLMPRCSLSCYI